LGEICSKANRDHNATTSSRNDDATCPIGATKYSYYDCCDATSGNYLADNDLAIDVNRDASYGCADNDNDNDNDDHGCANNDNDNDNDDHGCANNHDYSSLHAQLIFDF
jgi:hypothetical protein